MGWCPEFGVQVCEGCAAPMIAGASACTCEQCGTTCTGKFAGCPEVWARGPQLHLIPAPSRAANAGNAGPSAIDSLRADISNLSRMLTAQQSTLDAIVTRLATRQATVRPPVATAADAEAVAETPRDVLSRMEQVVFDLSESVGDIAVALEDLRAETQRVAAVGQLAHASLAVARQIERTAARVDQRLDELGAGLAAVRGRVDQLLRSTGAIAPPVASPRPASPSTATLTPVATAPAPVVPPAAP